MISLSNVRRAIERHWRVAGPPLPTRTADARFAAEHHAAWTELWVQPAAAEVRRNAGLDRVAFEVVVHLFADPQSPSGDASSATTDGWLDATRAAFERRTIAADGATLRLRECRFKDLSRDAAADGLPTRHVVVLVDGIADQAVEPVPPVSSDASSDSSSGSGNASSD